MKEEKYKMLKVDVKALENEIKECDKQIAKWEDKKEKLYERFENILECPKCHQHWDKAFAVREFAKYHYTKGGYMGDETHMHCYDFMELQCPACKANFITQKGWHCSDNPTDTRLTEQTFQVYPSQEYLYDSKTKKVEKAK